MSDKAAKTPEANRTRDPERKPRAEEQAGPDLVGDTVSVAGGAGEPTPSGNGVALLQREARPAGRGYSGAQAQMLLQLQRTRGNQAALRLLQRSPAKPQPQADTLELGDDLPADDTPHAGEPRPNGQPTNGLRVQRLADCPPPPPKAAPLPPQADPKFKAVESKAKQVASQEKKHAPAKAKAAEAQAASVPPANETASQAKAGQVDTMAEKKPGAFDKKAFVAAVKQAIEAASPKNLDEASNFKESGRAAQVKGQVSGMVTQNKETAQGDIKQATQAAPDASKAKPKEVKPMDKEQAGPPPAPVPAQSGMPSPKSAAETSLQSGKCEVDGMMKEAKVTDEQLAKSNEPQFKESLDAKKAQAEHADTAPKQVKQEEQKILGQAQAEAGKTAQQGVGGMHAARTGALGKLDTGKSDAKAKDEKARAEFSQKIEGIYAKTKTEVEAILKGLDGKVDQAFNQGEQAARTAFENYVKTKTDKFEDERYSGVGGKLQWVADRFSAPPELNQFVDEGRKLYLDKMNGVIDNVATIIETELNAAKARIAKGRQDIQAEVAKLPKHLQKEGAEAASKFEGQFDELDQQVDNKSEEMVQTLADKYVAAREAVDERVNAMKEANKGLYDRAKDAVKGVIETILKLKDMLLGVLSRAAGVIDKIIKDPIGFLGNLVSAVKAGLNQFMSNIGKHLLDGLMGWLFGELGSAGIQFPSTLDLKGVLSLVMQLLGLTWANIRARAVKIVGETVMARIEQVAEVFKILISEGPAGLWKFIQDKISDLKETVIGGIMDFVKDKIIVAGVTWLIGLLNPAAAFIKACKAIYDVVMFFIERGSQIMEFVNSILDSLEAIVGGNVSGVAGLIEKTLARILPLAISFLASLLGVGGIGEKIKKIIQAVQKPINKAIDAVIKPVLNLAKKGAKWLGGKIKAGAAWGKQKLTKLKERITGEDKLTPQEKEAKKLKKLQQAMAAATSAVNQYRGKKVGGFVLKAKLFGIKLRYGLKSLEPIAQGEKWSVRGEINPVLMETTEVTVLSDANEATALFVERAARVEREFFSTGLEAAGSAGGPAGLLRTNVEQQMAGAAQGGTQPYQTRGVSATEEIQSERALMVAHQRATGLQVPAAGVRRQTAGSNVLGEPGVNVSERLSPTANQQHNAMVNWLGAYDPTRAGSLPQRLGRLRDRGLSDADMSRLMQGASVSGAAVSPSELIRLGYRGPVREAQTDANFLTRASRLIFRREPLRFIDRSSPRSGENLPSEPVATATAMGHAMVQGGAIKLDDITAAHPGVIRADLPSGHPRSQAELSAEARAELAGRAAPRPSLGPATPRGVAGTRIQMSTIMANVREMWQRWVLATRQDLDAQIKARGIVDGHLVPSEEAMRQLLRQFYGKARNEG